MVTVSPSYGITVNCFGKYSFFTTACTALSVSCGATRIGSRISQRRRNPAASGALGAELGRTREGGGATGALHAAARERRRARGPPERAPARRPRESPPLRGQLIRRVLTELCCDVS